MTSMVHIRDYCDPGWPQGLRDFYAGRVGASLLPGIQEQMDEWLPQLFGYHALQLGFLGGGEDLLGASAIRHRVTLDLDAAAPTLQAMPGALPLQSDAIDLALLVHTLDFAVDPYQVLREVERVLIPEGHVLILGFNPLSLFGACKLLAGWRGRIPWRGRFYRASRVADWLSLLGFELRAQRSFGFRPPGGSHAVRERLGFMERIGARWIPNAGGVYLLLVRKHVAAVTPIGLRWRTRRALFPKLTGPAAQRDG